MVAITQETRFDLVKREAVTLGDAKDHVLICRGGTLWVTVDGGAGDIILAAGERYRIGTGAPVVVSALHAATVIVRYQQASGPRRAGARRLPVPLLQWEAAFPGTLIR